jgi:hypothetical protein
VHRFSFAPEQARDDRGRPLGAARTQQAHERVCLGWCEANLVDDRDHGAFAQDLDDLGGGQTEQGGGGDRLRARARRGGAPALGEKWAEQVQLLRGCDRLPLAVYAQLLEDVAHVRPDCLGADRELLRDLLLR